MLIEAVTGKDFRDVIRETVTEPLGLSKELYVGLPESEFGRAADMHEPKPREETASSPAPTPTPPTGAKPAHPAAPATAPRARWPRSTR